MSDDLVTVRIGKGAAEIWAKSGALLGWLRDKGIDTTTMSCREDGIELVYSSLPGKKGNAVTEENRVTKDNCGDGE